MLEELINEGEQQLKSKSLEGREYVGNRWANTIVKEQKSQDLPIGSPHHADQHMQKGNPSLHQCQRMLQQDVILWSGYLQSTPKTEEQSQKKFSCYLIYIKNVQ